MYNYYFIKRIVDDIKVLSYLADIITISDARLPEELDTINSTYPNVIKINIVRPEFDNSLNQTESVHRTETALDNYDKYNYEIINEGTLEELKINVFNLLDHDYGKKE